jgi:hypothetical protein
MEKHSTDLDQARLDREHQKLYPTETAEERKKREAAESAARKEHAKEAEADKAEAEKAERAAERAQHRHG